MVGDLQCESWCLRLENSLPRQNKGSFWYLLHENFPGESLERSMNAYLQFGYLMVIPTYQRHFSIRLPCLMPYACHISLLPTTARVGLIIFSSINWLRPAIWTILLLSRLLRITAHDFDLLRLDIVLVVELEVDILDEKRPDFVAESIRIQMALPRHTVSLSLPAGTIPVRLP